MEHSSPFGDYFGAALTARECDIIFLESDLSMEDVRIDKELVDVKWFDYRSMHPVKATYLFAEMYRRAYRYMTGQRFDINKAQYVQGHKGADIFALSSRQYKGFWKARVWADRMGVPYDTYIRAAMRWADRRLWKRIPRPAQLYSEEMREAIAEAWAEENKIRVPTAVNVFYHPENYVGHHWQKDYQRWVCDGVLTRERPEMALSTYLFRQPNLTEEIAIQHCGDDLVARARDFFDSTK